MIPGYRRGCPGGVHGSGDMVPGSGITGDTRCGSRATRPGYADLSIPGYGRNVVLARLDSPTGITCKGFVMTNSTTATGTARGTVASIKSIPGAAPAVTVKALTGKARFPS